MTVQLLAHQLLFILGLGFLVANVRVGGDLLRFWRARRAAILVWRPSRPRYYRLSILLGTIQGLLLASLVLLKVPASQIFSLAMMLVYFLAATPLILLYLATWAAGEAVGYALGGGRSLLKVR